jgi:hypothetical protein
MARHTIVTLNIGIAAVFSVKQVKKQVLMGTIIVLSTTEVYNMVSPDTSRRLSLRLISQDVDSLHGLQAVSSYSSSRNNATPEALQQAYQAMLTQQQEETEKLALYRAATDAARLAEWEFHNAVLAMKEVVRGQYGSDSNEAQAVGLKKKSDRKRPTRQKTIAVAS